MVMTSPREMPSPRSSHDGLWLSVARWAIILEYRTPCLRMTDILQRPLCTAARFRVLLPAVAVVLLALGAGPALQAQTRIFDAPSCDGPEPAPGIFTEANLTVLSVNLAHGRNTGKNQMLQSGETARKNIARAAESLSRHDAEVVALQEADAPSLWSGDFDHVAALADDARYPCRVHGPHAESRLFSFGTALISRVPFTRAAVHDFAPTPPTTRKGFVAAQVEWNPGSALAEPVTITLVSVHLDFSRKRVRETQYGELEEVLQAFPRPLVVMGDFNGEWSDGNGLLAGFAEQLGLHAWEPESGSLGTYDEGRKRLDWVLVSRELAFKDYRVLADVVSDHQPVLATLTLAGPAVAP